MSEAVQSILDTPPDLRKGMPLTFVVDPHGEKHVLSRYGDDRIDMSPYLKNPAFATSYIDLTLYPPRWRYAILDLLIAYWRYGRPGKAPPKASTVVCKASYLVSVVRWLDRNKVKRFRDIRPLHLASFSEHYLAEDERGRKRKPGSLRCLLSAIGLAWDMRDRAGTGMTVPPFGAGGNIRSLAKSAKRGEKVLSTESLSENDAALLEEACNDVLRDIEEVLADYEEIEEYKRSNLIPDGGRRRDRDIYWSMPHLYGRWQETGRRISDARAACFTLIGLLVGVRISELLLLDSDCYVETEVEGEMVGWIKGKSLKMRPNGSEATEWIAPPQVAGLVRIAERISAPIRARMRNEIEAMETELADVAGTLSEERKRYLLKRIREGKDALNRLFLSDLRNKKKSEGGTIRGAGRGSVAWIARVVERAGLKVNVHPHMLRKTYAEMVVLQCAGDLRYLRKQFQHWSIETTQLYATHPLREQDLVDEVAEEMLKRKVDLVSNWLIPNTTLAGIGGEHISAQRSRPELRGMIDTDLENVAKHLTDGLVVRSTGHSWCISTPTPSCGGQGLYDATYCAECDSAIVTEDKRSIWELLAQQMLEVRVLEDTGPAGRQLADRSLAAFDRILIPLGSSVEQVDQSMELAR